MDLRLTLISVDSKAPKTTQKHPEPPNSTPNHLTANETNAASTWELTTIYDYNFESLRAVDGDCLCGHDGCDLHRAIDLN